MKRSRGQPRKHNIPKLLRAFNAYIELEDVPIIAEFAYKNGLYREQMYEFGKDFPEFSYALKRCIAKKEAQLEKGALSGELNCSMAIFSLKQLGWRDTQSLEHSGPNGAALAPPVFNISFDDGAPGQ